MTTAITYTVSDALDMLRAAGVNAAAELTNIPAAYADICDEIEQAGGSASTGRERILELAAQSLHQRVPLIMGSARAVRAVDAIHLTVEPLFESSDAPLFARRGLFR